MVALGIMVGPGGIQNGFPGDSSASEELADELDLEQPPPMRQHATAAEVAARRAEKQRQKSKEQAMRAAGSVARERLGERGGPHRQSLFDADDWRKHTDARTRAMEVTYSRLYKPSTGARRGPTKSAPPARPRPFPPWPRPCSRLGSYLRSASDCGPSLWFALL